MQTKKNRIRRAGSLFLRGAVGAGFIATLVLWPRLARAATADFYKCTGRVSGEWNFGRAPHACNANAFGDDKFVTSTYGPVIFSDAAGRSVERARYVEELHAVVRDAARYYLQKRKPSVSPDELSWWTTAIITTASHESYMSHYRSAGDGRLKMMRGDSGHGHGLMQIDDRAHFPVINTGTAWNVITNLTYAMDIYFREWERAPAQSCVGGATQWEKRVRAAWSAYNGGPSSICRFANPNSSWAANDRSFYSMLRNRAWATHVANANKKTAINVPCLMENKENCPSSGTGTPAPSPQEPQEGSLYRTVDGVTCLFNSRKLDCVREFRDAICLNAVAPVRSEAVASIASQVASQYSRKDQDRHALCRSYEPSLFSVGSLVRLQKSIVLRSTPGGGALSTLALGSNLEILDFELRNATVRDRYYKLRSGSRVGYVYAGDSTDYASWVSAVGEAPTVPSAVARSGDLIQVVTSSGINLRATPGGAYLATVPSGANIRVDEPVVQGTNNSVYYRVTYSARQGYIYSGQLLPSSTTSLWTKVVP